MGFFRNGRENKNSAGVYRHGACACSERVRPIRFDQGIGAIDREAGLSQAADCRAGAAPGRAHPHHRLPHHHLPRRLRAGDRPDPAEALGDEARRRSARRHAGRAHRPPHRGAGRAHIDHRAHAEHPARPDPVLGQRAGPPCRRRHRRPAHPRPRAGRGRPRRAGPHPRHHLHGATDGQPRRRARRRHRHDPARRRRRARHPACDPLDAGPGDRHPGEERADLGLGRGTLDNAVGNDRLRRADPRLRLSLAIDPGARGRR